ncbi:Cgr1 family-domain-containing protein [Trametes meyenii]|nr:Cgr1 family-domain-containing protein [Trametes meyenii]
MPQPAESFIALSGEPSAQQTVVSAADASARSLAQTSAGRVSGKAWKVPKSATVRSHLPAGVKTKKWEERMEKTQKEHAIKKLQAELKQEKADEINRRKEVTLERKKAAEERQRLEEAKAKMGARKAARLRRKMGRTKKINH